MGQIARRLTLGGAIVAVCGLLTAAPAMGNSSVQTYGGNGGQVQALVQGTGGSSPGTTAGAAAPSASSPGTGALPFTGTDLALAAGGALVLLSAGAALALLTRARARLES
jgi:hypothetical protein